MKRVFLFLTCIILEAGLLPAQTATPPSSGDGSSDNPYQIASWQNLYWLSQQDGNSDASGLYWSRNYIQTSDITFPTSGGDDIHTWDSNQGWSPIGTESSPHDFSGSYNGQYHSINGLYINRSTNRLGLFGYTATTTVISNLGVTNVNISGNSTVGGLIGFNSQSAVVTNCYSTGSVSGTDHVGGLIGDHRGTVNRCYSKSSATGSGGSEDDIGSLLGVIYLGSVNNSYARGSASGDANVGGLIGRTNAATINKCYSTGSASGNSDVGGLIGEQYSSTCNNSFWDKDASGNTSSGAGTGKTTAEMKNVRTFTDVSWSSGLSSAWDFETDPYDDSADNNYWDMDGSQAINNGYPFLSWENGGEVSLPVEWISFSARCENGSVLLEWITESEVDNVGFILERAQKAVSPQWITIASHEFNDALRSQGNTSSRTVYQFVDKDVHLGHTYAYRLSDEDIQGHVTLADVISITLDDLPERTDLLPAYPNPFNPATKIQYTLANNTEVTLLVVDMLGRTVQRILTSRNQKAGSYSVYWNGKEETGRLAASGIYFLVLRAGAENKTQKVMLVR